MSGAPLRIRAPNKPAETLETGAASAKANHSMNNRKNLAKTPIFSYLQGSQKVAPNKPAEALENGATLRIRAPTTEALENGEASPKAKPAKKSLSWRKKVASPIFYYLNGRSTSDQSSNSKLPSPNVAFNKSNSPIGAKRRRTRKNGGLV